MSIVTDNVARYVSEKGISVRKMAEATGIAYQPLQVSLGDGPRNRDLRDDELLKVCIFLEKNPLDFAPKHNETQSHE